MSSNLDTHTTQCYYFKMKKTLAIIFISLFITMSVNAKTVNQRLDDIEKRLEKIEESLKALDFLNNLTQDLDTEPKKNSVTKSNSNSSKIEFTLRRIGCVKRDYTNKLEIEYTLDNNYAKATKLIDATFIINNLFDEELFSAKILRRADIDAKTSKNFAAEIDKTFDLDGDCSKLEQSSIDDYKIIFSVDKIAYADKSIEEF